MFNRYFASVFSEKSEIDMDAEAGDNGPYIGDVKVDRDVVLKYIQRMGQNKAPGADNIYPRVLRGNCTHQWVVGDKLSFSELQKLVFGKSALLMASRGLDHDKIRGNSWKYAL